MTGRRRISWRRLLEFVVLAAVVTLALTNQEGAMAIVIDPLTRLSWWMTRTLLMVDQEIYWTALIFIVLAFGLRLLPARREMRRPAIYSSGFRPADRIAEWEKLIRQAAGDEEGRQALITALQELQDQTTQCAGLETAAAVELPQLKRGPLSNSLRRRINRMYSRLAGREPLFQDEYGAGIAAILERIESMMEGRND